MDRIDDVYILVTFGEGPEPPADVFQLLAKAFPAVVGDQDDPSGAFDFSEPMGKVDVGLDAIQAADRRLESVHYRVAGDEDAFLRYPFHQKILTAKNGGGEAEIGQCVGQAAVGLLGEGIVFIVGPESGLHMPHLDLKVVGR